MAITIDVASNSALLEVAEKLAEQNNILRGGMTTIKGDSVFVRYSANADGTDFTETWSVGQNYIGLTTGQDAPIDKTAYNWVLFKGDKGDNAPYIGDNGNWFVNDEDTGVVANATITGAEVVQITGDSETAVMSQKAITESINTILSAFETEGCNNILDPNNSESGYYNVTDGVLTQVAGYGNHLRTIEPILVNGDKLYISFNLTEDPAQTCTIYQLNDAGEIVKTNVFSTTQVYPKGTITLDSSTIKIHMWIAGVSTKGLTFANFCLSTTEIDGYEKYGAPKRPTTVKESFLPANLIDRMDEAKDKQATLEGSVADIGGNIEVILEAFDTEDGSNVLDPINTQNGYYNGGFEKKDSTNHFCSVGFVPIPSGETKIYMSTNIPNTDPNASAANISVLFADVSGAYLITYVAKVSELPLSYTFPTNATQFHFWTSGAVYGYKPENLCISFTSSTFEEYSTAKRLSAIKPEMLPDGISNTIALEYNTDVLSRENERLKRDLDFMTQRQSGLYDLKSGATVDSQTVTLKNTSKQKLILHLHRYANSGFDTVNDVFLPNAKKNFSDIRITDNRGNALPYFINKISDLDIVEDSRVHVNGDNVMLKDSQGNLITVKGGTIHISSDNGESWDWPRGLTGCKRVVAINPDDSLLVDTGDGKLCKSYAPYDSYEIVLDCSEYTGVYFMGGNIKRLQDGSLILGAYQLERSVRIYKSTNNGNTWTKIYDGGDKYQHVHSIYVDNSQGGETIYAGIDGGGGVLKSTDGGTSWVDLKEVVTIPQASDFGVLYAENGFRLLSGETSVVGGHSIIRTEDDVNFTPVLSLGNSVGAIKKLGNYLIAGLCGTNWSKSHGFVVSKDKGLTWDRIYTTSPFTDSVGTNDGFRRMFDGIFENTIIAQCQSESRKTVRITAHDEPVYAEIIVDVPEDTTSLTVENGYAIGNTILMHNDYEPANKKLLHYPLNEGGGFIKETVSGNIYKFDGEFMTSGKNFDDELNKRSASVSSLDGYAHNITIPNSFTISFWDIRPLETDDKLNLICKGAHKLHTRKHKLLFDDVHIANSFYPFVGGTQRVDIAFDGENKTIKCYNNGHLVSAQYASVDVESIINAFAGEGEITVLQNVECLCERGMQHFTIYDGVLSEYDMLNSCHFELSDNHQIAQGV